MLADAHPADHLDDRFHADEARRAHRHQVARLFEAPAHRMFAAAAAAAEVAEAFIAQRRALIDAEGPVDDRSEEHTSELQSLMRISYAVCCLKKKKIREERKTNKKQDKDKQNRQNR